MGRSNSLGGVEYPMEESQFQVLIFNGHCHSLLMQYIGML